MIAGNHLTCILPGPPGTVLSLACGADPWGVGHPGPSTKEVAGARDRKRQRIGHLFTGGHPGTLTTRERRRGAWAGALAAAGLCIAASSAGAQSRFFLRVAPEAGRAAVEHTKTVTIRGGSSSSTSSSSGPALAGTLSAGILLPLPGNWLVGAEIEGVASGRRRLEGTIAPTPDGNPHDVWPGRWELRDLYGAGGQILLGRSLGDDRPQLYLLGGMRGMRTEFASGWTNPATGTPGEDRRHLDRWPWTVGVGYDPPPPLARGSPDPLFPVGHRLDHRPGRHAARLQVQGERPLPLGRHPGVRLTARDIPAGEYRRRRLTHPARGATGENRCGRRRTPRSARRLRSGPQRPLLHL